MNFFELKGQTIKSIDIGKDSIDFETDLGKYHISHGQDCCEVVRFVKTVGDINNLLNSPITLAQDDHPNDPDWYSDRYRDDSHTWTAFFLETEKGRVEFWALGESNGWYGETMTFYKF